ncbi:MAG: hypothetical protein IJQ50_02255 [Clostridia bacterium]|nr:hypothetical protein [Clostridia bacterium]
MGTKKEMTVPITSVGADEEQPNAKSNAIIAEFYEKCNISDESFEEIQREMIYSQNPFYLKTVQMNKLYDTVYQSKPPIIDGLLYPGTYLFAGAPKIGKSFLMAQLAYPKYLLSSTEPQDELKQIIKVLEKYNSKEQIVRMFNDSSESSSFNLLAVYLFLLHDYYENGVYNALAPRIQMPIEMFKKAASRLITETRLEAGNYDLIDIIEPVIDKLALEFGVSRAAAKIRMVDAGYEEAIGAFNYIDGHYVTTHKARKGFLKRNATFSISVQDAAIQRVVDPKLKEAIENGRYQYVDSHYVRSSPLYLEYDENGNTRLTHYARNHMDECCLVFQMSIIGQVGEKYHSECFLNRDERSLIDFDVAYHGGYENSTDKNQLKLLRETIAEENRIYGMLPNDYAAALRMVIDWRNDQIKAEKEAHPNKDISKITAKEIAERTKISEATVRRTLKGEQTSTNTLVLICLALHLPYKISRHIIDRSPAPLSMSNPNHQLYDFVLGTHYGKTVKEVKSLLAIYGAEPL